MFRSRSWFGGGWGRPKNPHSLEHLKYLYNVLSRNQTVSEHNRGLLVESLRSIAEILIWGDQNDSSVFDFFLEKNMLSFFLRIMRQRSGGSSFVCVQLLQTLNILFENIRNETSLYYLLSNNHVNSIIVHKFDFSDEEVMAYYISFLKTLSLKLNAHTIHFFYNEHTNDFPLYTEAIKFFNHPESMVRIAVRTLTLNVYKVEDASMLAFIRDRTAAPYFSNIVWFIGKHITELDACVRNDADHQSQNRLSDLVAEHLDHLHYLNDILCLNIPDVNQVLTEHLLHKLLIPMYIYSLNSTQSSTQENSIEIATQNLARILNRRVNLPENRTNQPQLVSSTIPDTNGTNGKVSCVVALFLLSQVFLIISHAPLIETLSWILLKTDRVVFEKGVGKLLELYETEYKNVKNVTKKEKSGVNSENVSGNSQNVGETSQNLSSENSEISQTTNNESDGSFSTDDQPSKCNITDEEKQQLQSTDGAAASSSSTEELADKPFLNVVLNALDCAENDYAALFALSLLYAMANNKGVKGDLLDNTLRPRKSVTRTTTSSTSSGKDIKYTYNHYIVERLLHIVLLSCQPSCSVRLVTLELVLKLLGQLVMCDGKNILTEAHRGSIENGRVQSMALLRNFYKSEEIFLDMFEFEYCDMSKSSLNVEWLCMDSAILLPPTGTPMTGIDFTRRLPCGEVERARRAIRVFFLVRETVLQLQTDIETQLPLTSPQSCVKIEQALDLSIARCVSKPENYNSDLLACTVAWKDGTKIRRFLVIDVMQLILVEPDTKKLGWGVAKLVGFLQDIEVTGDKDDSRCLHITIHKPLTNTTANRIPLLSAKFIFDDNIRCMAAKQRLTKGRIKVRQKKMQHIARLLDIPGQVAGPPSPAYVGAGGGGGSHSHRSRAYHSSAAARVTSTLFGVGLSSSRLAGVPGFAAPSTSVVSIGGGGTGGGVGGTGGGVLHRVDAAEMRRRRHRSGSRGSSESPSRLAMMGSGGAREGGAGGTGVGVKMMRSRETSANRGKSSSRDNSPRMPRPRSEEIPLVEVTIKLNPLDSGLDPMTSSSPKISILPRPQTPVITTDAVNGTDSPLTAGNNASSTGQKADGAMTTVADVDVETSFIGETSSPKRKGVIETV